MHMCIPSIVQGSRSGSVISLCGRACVSDGGGIFKGGGTRL